MYFIDTLIYINIKDKIVQERASNLV